MVAPSEVPAALLNNGITIPQLGFGVFQIDPDGVVAPVRAALDSGYRLLDTATVYGNEAGVGRALAESGLAREDVFVTTKLATADQGYDSTLRAFDTSLELLGLDELDLYLIHWPAPGRDRYVESWKALEALYGEGRVRAIGVSNFQPAHLDRLAQETQIVPAINQVELHPRLTQTTLRAYHEEHDIVTEAWSPIGQGKGLLDDPAIVGLAGRYGRSPAQVVLRWHLQLGNVVIPKSTHAERIAENIDVFDFFLDDDAMAVLSGLDRGERVGPDPDTFNP